MKHVSAWAMFLMLAGFGVVGGCGDDDDEGPPPGPPPRPEQTGAMCDVASECYPKVADKTTIQGTIECMTRVRDGFCTHACVQDTDCCAADGECETDIRQVCAPFESEPGTKCFLSCEAADLPAGENDTEFCQRKAGPDFICRASGGGDPRKICMPADCGVGATCSDTLACPAGLDCVSAFPGGYCGRQDCALDADCPADSRCVQHANGTNYCFATCANDTDCSVCRGTTYAADCRSDVTFVEGTPVSVCVPR